MTRQGKEAVVVLPAEGFERLQARSRQPQTIVPFFAVSPLAKVAIDLGSIKPDHSRVVEL